MKIRLDPTEPDEKQRYSERDGVSVERAVGGVLIAFGPGMEPEVHQWGPNPECVQAMQQLCAQLGPASVAEIVRRVLQNQAERAAAARQEAMVRNSLKNNRGIVQP